MVQLKADISNAHAVWPDYEARLFDASKVPYSTALSFLTISVLEDGALYLRQMRGGDEHNDAGKLLRLELLDDTAQVIAAELALYPDCLCLRPQTASHGDPRWLALSLGAADFLGIQAQGLGLRLSMQAQNYDYLQHLGQHIKISSARQDVDIWLQQRQGTRVVDAPWQGLRAAHIQLDLLSEQDGLCASLHVARLPVPAPTYYNFCELREANQKNFSSWLGRSLSAPANLQAGRLLAAYICWSCLVPAEGKLNYPAMYMSHNWMTNIWSWDHCFNALALAQHQPELAWQQMAVIFEQQDTCGRLPDFINDQFCYWRFTKPPVHGWTFSLLRKFTADFYTREKRRLVVGWLDKLSHYWLSHAQRGLPCYDHGNDAGWDNSTIFLAGTPLQSPDLASFLILQMAEQASLYDSLDEAESAEYWRQRAQHLLQTMLQNLSDGERCFARHAQTKEIVSKGDSLIQFIPLLLGASLPANLRKNLLRQLAEPGRFLSDYGYATEALNSPFYQEDGYWRGPIWAPVSLLLYHALQANQEFTAARELARKFTTMAAGSGMAENFSATSGAGLRDPAFTWTSSVYLYLANQLQGTNCTDGAGAAKFTR